MDQYVLMADVVKSSERRSNELMENFKSVVNAINTIYHSQLASPLTITLGDEFQGIAKTLKGALEILIGLEEEIIIQQAGFKLRYVLVEGEISTPINSDIAYEMLGEGLTDARKKLEEFKKSKRGRFSINLKNEKSLIINNLFFLLSQFVDRWHEKDLYTVSLFLQGFNYKEVAEKIGKHETSTWRKKSSLAIEEYETCLSLINQVVNV